MLINLCLRNDNSLFTFNTLNTLVGTEDFSKMPDSNWRVFSPNLPPLSSSFSSIISLMHFICSSILLLNTFILFKLELLLFNK